MSGSKHRYQANCPRHADPELFRIIHASVAGAVKGFNNDHPNCLIKNQGSLLKRICNQLTTKDVEKQLRIALLESANANT